MSKITLRDLKTTLKVLKFHQWASNTNYNEEDRLKNKVLLSLIEDVEEMIKYTEVGANQ